MSPVRNGHAVRAIPEYAYGKTKNVEQSKTQQKKSEKNKQSKAEQWSTVEFKAKQATVMKEITKATNSKYS